MPRQSYAWIWILGAVLVLMAKKAYGFAVKPGAVVPLSEEMRYASDVIAGVWAAQGRTAVLTSGLDGEHKEDSLHYSGLATDWRTKDLPALLKQSMVSDVRAILGRNYDVLLESSGLPSEHMHVEYDPK